MTALEMARERSAHVRRDLGLSLAQAEPVWAMTEYDGYSYWLQAIYLLSNGWWAILEHGQTRARRIDSDVAELLLRQRSAGIAERYFPSQPQGVEPLRGIRLGGIP